MNELAYTHTTLRKKSGISGLSQAFSSIKNYDLENRKYSI